MALFVAAVVAGLLCWLLHRTEKLEDDILDMKEALVLCHVAIDKLRQAAAQEGERDDDVG